MKHLHEPPPTIACQRPGADVPEAVERFLLANLSKDPAQRSPDALAYRQAFAAACGPAQVGPSPGTPPPDPAGSQGRSSSSFRHVAAGLVLTVAVAVAVLAGMPPSAAHAGGDGPPMPEPGQRPQVEPTCTEHFVTAAETDWDWSLGRSLADHLSRLRPDALPTPGQVSAVQPEGPPPSGKHLPARSRRAPVRRTTGRSTDKPPSADLKQALGLLD